MLMIMTPLICDPPRASRGDAYVVILFLRLSLFMAAGAQPAVIMRTHKFIIAIGEFVRDRVIFHGNLRANAHPALARNLCQTRHALIYSSHVNHALSLGR